MRDLAIHPRDNDLVIATHGRGIWIIDDITPLRALTPETLANDVVFAKAKPTVAGDLGGRRMGERRRRVHRARTRRAMR